MSLFGTTPSDLDLEDLLQLIIGAFALAVPVSFSEEAWHLGETLPTLNLLLVVLLSLGFLSIYAAQSLFQGRIRDRLPRYLLRLILAYGITLVVVSLVLLALDKWPLLTEPADALRRTLVVSLPASMGAIVVDALDKE
ncbi:DUF2391 family protein [Ferrimonas gelatinilytica]|uniref:DUF2391 family protein n=1 Tax=Ferrimonas gelatinilytica TaxID=1255257 RepID=A0ABP9S3K8_9GAMM